jgi:mRNA-degrading endonuclease toxin of MazEF toxin-antitoxin module
MNGGRSFINGDGLHTVAKSSLIRNIGAVDAATMGEVCWPLGYALGC